MEYQLNKVWLFENRLLSVTITGVVGSVGDTPLAFQFGGKDEPVPQILALDLGQASLITSHGIRQLLNLQTALNKESVTFWLICSNPFTLDLLNHLSLHHLFIIKEKLPTTL